MPSPSLFFLFLRRAEAEMNNPARECAHDPNPGSWGDGKERKRIRRSTGRVVRRSPSFSASSMVGPTQWRLAKEDPTGRHPRFVERYTVGRRGCLENYASAQLTTAFSNVRSTRAHTFTLFGI